MTTMTNGAPDRLALILARLSQCGQVVGAAAQMALLASPAAPEGENEAEANGHDRRPKRPRRALAEGSLR